MKIVFFETTPEEQKTLAEFLNPQAAEFHEEKLTMDNINLAQDAEVISVFINSMVSKEIIGALPNLKLITTRSTGFDHIDLAAAKERGINVTNVPGYGSLPVAEFTFALILNLSRKIFSARHQLMEGDNFDISKLEGFNLYGKTLGVIGTGRVGKNVIRIAKGFGMNVLAYDVKADDAFATENNFKYVEMPDLLGQSDIVTLHSPYNEQTHHLINKDNIGLLKKGAYLINTARGELVETDALVNALTSGNLAGAGLDVLEAERQMKEEIVLLARGAEEMKDFKTMYENQVLLDMPNVIVTPHIAFCTTEAKLEIQKITAENIKQFISGTAQNLV